MDAYDNPLSSREGMVHEVLETAKVYPLLLVVVATAESVACLQQMLAASVQERHEIAANKFRLQNCDIIFVQQGEVEKYRGTVPVFYDPGTLRRAA